jgi:Zn-dependent protease/predicted transcriptional regulator
MNFSLYLGKFKNIKVFIHWTFTLLLLWIVISNLRSGADYTEILWTLAFVLALFFCVLLHEFGHALAAQKYNISTKDITLLPIGGVARLEKLPEDPKQELWVAFAGPLVNVGIFLVLTLVISVTGTPFLEIENFEINAATFLVFLASSNLILALFNLLPAFPMDGGRVLRAFLAIRMPRAKATRIAGGIGQLMAILFVFYGLFSNPVLVLIGIFIFLGAAAEVKHTQQESLLKGYQVKDALMTNFELLEFDAPLSKAIEKLLNSQTTHFVVVKADVALGTLSKNEIIKGLQKGSEGQLIDQVADYEPLRLEKNQDLDQAWKEMNGLQKKVAFVMDNGQFIGILDQENILEFINVRSVLNQKS